MAVEKDTVHELDIERMAFGGMGVGTIDAKVCLVPGVAPGERVRVIINSVKSNHYKALPLAILKPSSARIEPKCPYALHPASNGKKPRFCPGCAYAHLDYAAELEIKDRQFRDFILRHLQIDGLCIASALPSPLIEGYRNKLVLHVCKDGNDTQIGYFMEDNQSIIDIDQCLLAREEINAEYRHLRQDKGFYHSLRDGMTLTFRHNENSSVLFWRNRPPRNQSWLRENNCSTTISVPAESFCQINAGGCDLLLNEVTAKIKELAPTHVIDLYCGSGLFSVAAAVNAIPKLTLLDSDGPAIEAARYNLKDYDCECRFLTGQAEQLIGDICHGNMDDTLMIADPPRTGLEAKVCNAIADAKLKNLLYISCGADTLTRDLKILLDAGFQYRYGRVIDMFPRTAHFESVNFLQR